MARRLDLTLRAVLGGIWLHAVTTHPQSDQACHLAGDAAETMAMAGYTTASTRGGVRAGGDRVRRRPPRQRHSSPRWKPA